MVLVLELIAWQSCSCFTITIKSSIAIAVHCCSLNSGWYNHRKIESSIQFLGIQLNHCGNVCLRLRIGTRTIFRRSSPFETRRSMRYTQPTRLHWLWVFHLGNNTRIPSVAIKRRVVQWKQARRKRKLFSCIGFHSEAWVLRAWFARWIGRWADEFDLRLAKVLSMICVVAYLSAHKEHAVNATRSRNQCTTARSTDNDTRKTHWIHTSGPSSTKLSILWEPTLLMRWTHIQLFLGSAFSREKEAHVFLILLINGRLYFHEPNETIATTWWLGKW